VVAAHPSADEDALLDWNESPIGPPALAVKRVIDAAERIHRYPRGLMEEIAVLAAGHFGVAPENILLTAGVDEAIDITLSLAARAWGVQPGFDGYEDRVRTNGKPFHPIPLGADPAVWIARIRAVAGHVFIDETYQEFSSAPSVLRTGPGTRGCWSTAASPRPPGWPGSGSAA
jgi:histidinol-phosphate aminotransferase